MNEDQIFEEIWMKCGEQLELIPPITWGAALAPVLVKLLVKERQENDYLKKRLDHVRTNSRL